MLAQGRADRSGAEGGVALGLGLPEFVGRAFGSVNERHAFEAETNPRLAASLNYSALGRVPISSNAISSGDSADLLEPGAAPVFAALRPTLPRANIGLPLWGVSASTCIIL